MRVLPERCRSTGGATGFISERGRQLRADAINADYYSSVPLSKFVRRRPRSRDDEGRLKCIAYADRTASKVFRESARCGYTRGHLRAAIREIDSDNHFDSVANSPASKISARFFLLRRVLLSLFRPFFSFFLSSPITRNNAVPRNLASRRNPFVGNIAAAILGKTSWTILPRVILSHDKSSKLKI